MKQVTLQIKMNVPNNCPLDGRDDIYELLIDTFDSCGGGGGVFIDGKVI